MENMTEVQSCTDIPYSLPPFNVTSQVISVTNLSQCHAQSALYKPLSFQAVTSLLLQITFHNICPKWIQRVESRNLNFSSRLWEDSPRKMTMTFHRHQYRRHQKAKLIMRINLFHTNTWKPLVLNAGLHQSGIIWLHAVVSPNYAQGWRPARVLAYLVGL